MKSLFKPAVLVIPFLMLGATLSACNDDSDAQANAPLPVASAQPAAPVPAPVPVQDAKPAEEKPAHKPAHRPARVENAAPAICGDCGVITAITPVHQKGEGSGAGAVMGAVLGGVIAHQFGKGRGKDAATVAGAAAGAYGGHQAEKEIRATNSYDVSIRMDDGSTRVINMTDTAGLTVGSKVKVNGNMVAYRG